MTSQRTHAPAFQRPRALSARDFGVVRRCSSVCCAPARDTRHERRAACAELLSSRQPKLAEGAEQAGTARFRAPSPPASVRGGCSATASRVARGRRPPRAPRAPAAGACNGVDSDSDVCRLPRACLAARRLAPSGRHALLRGGRPSVAAAAASASRGWPRRCRARRSLRGSAAPAGAHRAQLRLRAAPHAPRCAGAGADTRALCARAARRR